MSVSVVLEGRCSPCLLLYEALNSLVRFGCLGSMLSSTDMCAVGLSPFVCRGVLGSRAVAVCFCGRSMMELASPVLFVSVEDVLLASRAVVELAHSLETCAVKTIPSLVSTVTLRTSDSSQIWIGCGATSRFWHLAASVSHHLDGVDHVFVEQPTDTIKSRNDQFVPVVSLHASIRASRPSARPPIRAMR